MARFLGEHAAVDSTPPRAAPVISPCEPRPFSPGHFSRRYGGSKWRLPPVRSPIAGVVGGVGADDASEGGMSAARTRELANYAARVRVFMPEHTLGLAP